MVALLKTADNLPAIRWVTVKGKRIPLKEAEGRATALRGAQGKRTEQPVQQAAPEAQQRPLPKPQIVSTRNPLSEAGKRKAETPEQRRDRMIRSKEFKAWFGDWENEPEKASKVVDEKGEPEETYSIPDVGNRVSKEPKPLWHGTTKDFREFDFARLGEYSDHPSAHLGFYFTEDPTVAKDFTEGKKDPMQCYLNLRNPYEMEAKEFEEELDFWRGLKGSRSDNQYERSAEHFRWMRDWCLENGYDGMRIVGGETAYPELEKDNWIAFEPTQIKSVDNEGTFDPDNADIYKRNDKAIHWVTVRGQRIPLNPKVSTGEGFLRRTMSRENPFAELRPEDLQTVVRQVRSGELRPSVLQRAAFGAAKKIREAEESEKRGQTLIAPAGHGQRMKPTADPQYKRAKQALRQLRVLLRVLGLKEPRTEEEAVELAFSKSYVSAPVPPGPALVREDLDSMLDSRKRGRKRLRRWARRKRAMKKQSDTPRRWITVRGRRVPLLQAKGKRPARPPAIKPPSAKPIALPSLKGTEKQIAWAEKIRQKALADEGQARGSMEAALEGTDAAARERAADALALLEEVRRKDSASWWIDHRDTSLRQLLREAWESTEAGKAYLREAATKTLSESETKIKDLRDRVERAKRAALEYGEKPEAVEAAARGGSYDTFRGHLSNIAHWARSLREAEGAHKHIEAEYAEPFAEKKPAAELKGTEKQVKWAESLREKALRASRSEQIRSMLIRQHGRADAERAVQTMTVQPSAKYWIDRFGRADAVSALSNVVREIIKANFYRKPAAEIKKQSYRPLRYVSLRKQVVTTPVAPGPALVREDLDSTLDSRKRGRKRLRRWARRKRAMKKRATRLPRWVTVVGNHRAMSKATGPDLKVEQRMTTPSKPGKKPRPVWVVSGDTRGFDTALRALGGRKFRGMWSFWKDPSDEVGKLTEDDRESFAERKESEQHEADERAERYAGYAEHAAQRASAAHERAHQIGEQIPLGQPILVGHHSERRHRRDIARIRSATERGIEESEKAEHWKGRATTAEQKATGEHSVSYLENRLKEAKAAVGRAQRELERGRLGGKDSEKSHWERVKSENEEKMAYWQDRLKAAGGVKFGKHNIKAGDEVMVLGRWMLVLKANPKTVTVSSEVGNLPVEWSRVSESREKAGGPEAVRAILTEQKESAKKAKESLAGGIASRARQQIEERQTVGYFQRGGKIIPIKKQSDKPVRWVTVRGKKVPN